MKKLTLVFKLILVMFISTASCDKDSSLEPDDRFLENEIPNDTTMTEITSNKLRISIGSSSFTATLSDNASARAFKAQLPLTLNMIELNGNEKYVDLSQSLPTSASIPSSIQNGDLMLYGANTLVLFYKSFNTSYSYTKLGKIDNPTGLPAALGNSNITVRFEIIQ